MSHLRNKVDKMVRARMSRSRKTPMALVSTMARAARTTTRMAASTVVPNGTK